MWGTSMGECTRGVRFTCQLANGDSIGATKSHRLKSLEMDGTPQPVKLAEAGTLAILSGPGEEDISKLHSWDVMVPDYQLYLY